MSTTNKTRPLARISFCPQEVDPQTGEKRLGKPSDVGTIWPRKNGKQGGRIDWKVKPQDLFEGACFVTFYSAKTKTETEKGFA